MKTSLFISDLHLHPEHPEIIRLFRDFLEEKAGSTDRLFILGDLFEYWLGDDAVSHSGYQEIVDALASASANDTEVYFMHGNRDFLVGEQFSSLIGGTLLPDPTRFNLDGVDVLLMHGDSLCTDDIEHQKFRALSRSNEWQQDILSKSIAERQEIANHLRMTSEQGNAEKSNEIMDVNQSAVADVMRQQQVCVLIHGHTHRIAVHDFSLDEAPVHRIVLGDWYRKGSYLRHNEQGFELISYPDESVIASLPPINVIRASYSALQA